MLMSALAVCLALYFAPTVVAVARHHSQSIPIFLFNLALGFTLIGWAGCLVWALAYEAAPSPSERGPRIAQNIYALSWIGSGIGLLRLVQISCF